MPCSYARTFMRRRCDVSAFFGARAGVGAGVTEESTAGLAALVRGFTVRAARTFFTVFSAVIEPAEYAPSPPKMQRLFLRKIGPEGQDSQREEEARLEPVALLNGLDERDAEKDDEHREIRERWSFH